VTVLVLVTLRRVFLQNRDPISFGRKSFSFLVGGIATLKGPALVLHQQITGNFMSHRAEINLNKTQSLWARKGENGVGRDRRKPTAAGLK
jgi:hypothetical protein